MIFNFPQVEGRCALAVRYAQGLFVNTYDPVIENLYRFLEFRLFTLRKLDVIDGRTCIVDVLVTAGQVQLCDD